MAVQYAIIAIILAACITYAAFCITKVVRHSRKCKDYHCAGCAFYEKCKANDKKLHKKFGGTK